jgi:hypothetical protein
VLLKISQKLLGSSLAVVLDTEFVQATISVLTLLAGHKDGLVKLLASIPMSDFAGHVGRPRHCIVLALFAALPSTPVLVPSTIALLAEMAGGITDDVMMAASGHLESQCPCRREVLAPVLFGWFLEPIDFDHSLVIFLRSVWRASWSLLTASAPPSWLTGVL